LGWVLQAGDLIAQGDILFGQRLEAPVIFHVLFHLGGLFRRDALGEFFAVKEALQHKIGAAPGGRSGRAGLKKLFAQRAAAEALDRLHLQQNGLPFLEQAIAIQFHACFVSV
jgi:hypothetical protein